MRFVLRGGAGKWGKPTRGRGGGRVPGGRTEKKEGKGEGEGVCPVGELIG